MKITKLMIVCLLFSLFLCCFTAAAVFSENEQEDPVTCGECGADGDNLTWNFDKESGTLTFSGSGAMADYIPSSSRPWAAYINDVKNVALPEGLTRLGATAFSRCVNLTVIELPSSLESIGIQAFAGTESLEKLTIPDSVTDLGTGICFYSGVKNVTFGKGVKAIPESAFEQCLQLSEVVFPETLEEIGSGAFIKCASLETVALNDGLLVLDDYAFDRTGLRQITIPGSVSSLGYMAFAYCNDLESVRIENGITEIPEWAFTHSKVKEAKLPASVKTIRKGAFYACPFTEIELPESIETIGDLAFYHSGLTSVTVPASVSKLGFGVFSCCEDLEEIMVAEENEGFCAVDGVLFSKDMKSLYNYPSGKADKKYTVPAGVERIEKYSCEDILALEEIVIPEGAVSIADEAFDACPVLRLVTLPDSLTEIGSHAFGYLCIWVDGDYMGNPEYSPVEGFTITGTKGGAAEAYAAENGFAFTEISGSPGTGDNGIIISAALIVMSAVICISAIVRRRKEL